MKTDKPVRTFRVRVRRMLANHLDEMMDSPAVIHTAHHVISANTPPERKRKSKP